MMRKAELAARTINALTLVALMLIGAPVGMRAHAQTAGTATLAGVVRDSLGRPLSEVDVGIPGNGSVRTDSAGQFQLTAAAPATYEVWFRRIGFSSSQFMWTAESGVRTEVEAHLRLLPHTLDPMIVREREDKSMTSKSSVFGHVVDSLGGPIGGVEVQLLGAGQVTRTRTDGSFAFRHVLPGDLTMRTRLFGLAPAVFRLHLLDADQREVTLRMDRLSPTLDTVVTTARSGFGPSEEIWRELDRRQHLRSKNLSVYLGPDVLGRYGGTSLDLIAATSGAHGAMEANSMRRTPTSIRSDAITPSRSGPSIAGDACILENGVRPLRMPIRAYSARDVDAVEFYPASPPESEETRTIYARFGAIRECAPPDPQNHPAYWVIWLKRSPEPE